MNIKPLADNVLVKAEKQEKVSPGGIIIPDNAQEKTQMAYVVAIGDSEDIKVKIDQKIMYEKYAGHIAKIEKEEYIVLKYKDIIAIIE